MPTATRKAAKKVQNESPEEFSDIVMDDFEGEVGDESPVEHSSQSQSIQTASTKRAPRKTAKVAEPRKRVNSAKKPVTDTKSYAKTETTRDTLKSSTSGRSAGPIRRVGLSKRAVPRGPPSPVRISK